MEKILNRGERICLFCGKEIESQWDEYDEYYECNCNDAVKNRLIDEKIATLERSRPEPKFEIEQRDVLIKITS